MTVDSEVTFTRQGAWGVITLNRPKALNALTENMCEQIYAQLMLWRNDQAVSAILIKGSEGRAFCAGGDIRWLYDTSKNDPERAAEFFRTEYKMNSLIHQFPKPYVALMHGIIMGGGVGVSISASHRVVCEDVMWAMPETGIGLVPDVGGSHFLARLEGGMGEFLGLSGHRLNGAEAVDAGIATHLVRHEDFDAIQAALYDIEPLGVSTDSISKVLSEFLIEAKSGLVARSREIEKHFAGADKVEHILSALEGESDPFWEKVLGRLHGMSPTSMKLTLDEIKRGQNLSFDDCLKMEFGIVFKLMHGSDFHEGVRAQIVDKDRNPQWSPSGIDQVTDEFVASFFEDLGDRALDLVHG